MLRFIQPNILLYLLLLVFGGGGFLFAVVWPETIGFYTSMIFAAIGGFGVAYYIFHTKRGGGSLVCPTGSDCNAVINSRYSKFLGVHIEYFGMAYYLVIVFSYSMLVFTPQLFPQELISVLIMLTAGAFLFSLYLLFVQAFILRQWCIWCLLSATFSIGIFIASLASFGFAVSFLVSIATALRLMHAFGFVLGLGGAIAAAFLFSKFLSDRDIDNTETRSLQGLSEMIWLGLALTVASQLAFYVIYVDMQVVSVPFLIQIMALFVTVVASAVLMIVLAPFLGMIPFSVTSPEKEKSFLASLRRPVFLFGSVALSSWLFAFLMDYLPIYDLGYLLLVYALFVAGAMVIGLLWEDIIKKPVSEDNKRIKDKIH